MREQGRVIAVEGNCCWVETQQKSTCGGCAAKIGCGQSLLARLHDGRKNVLKLVFSQPIVPLIVPLDEVFSGEALSSKASRSNQSLAVELDRPISVGDTIEFSVPDNAVLLASAIVYLLPLLCMIMAVIVGSYLGWSEGVLIMVSCLSLSTGFFAAKQVSAQSYVEPFMPVFQCRVTGSDEFSVAHDLESHSVSSPM